MCKKLQKNGMAFIKISNLGTSTLSIGYDCFHTNDLFEIMAFVGKELGDMFYKENPQAIITQWVIKLLADAPEDNYNNIMDTIKKIRNGELKPPKIKLEKAKK